MNKVKSYLECIKEFHPKLFNTSFSQLTSIKVDAIVFDEECIFEHQTQFILDYKGNYDFVTRIERELINKFNFETVYFGVSQSYLNTFYRALDKLTSLEQDAVTLDETVASPISMDEDVCKRFKFSFEIIYS